MTSVNTRARKKMHPYTYAHSNTYIYPYSFKYINAMGAVDKPYL